MTDTPRFAEFAVVRLVTLERLYPDEIAPTGDDRCLQELEGDDWGDPDPDGWRMPERCKALRRTPLTDLTADDLRLLIGQNIGLEHLLRPALRLLRDDPLRRRRTDAVPPR